MPIPLACLESYPEVPESHVSLKAKKNVHSLSMALHLRLVSEKGCEREWERCCHPSRNIFFLFTCLVSVHLWIVFFPSLFTVFRTFV